MEVDVRLSSVGSTAAGMKAQMANGLAGGCRTADSGLANGRHVDSGVANGGHVDSGMANGGHVDSGVANGGHVDSGVANGGHVDSSEELNVTRLLPASNQVRELQTLLRDRGTSRSDFVFYADRLIRLVVEEALNCLPYQRQLVTTPCGEEFAGLRYSRGNCGVSVMRSGEAMEKGLRDCCRAMRVGKILIQIEDGRPQPIYVKLPPDVSSRKVLLMYPVLGDGGVALKAVQLLVEEYRVPEASILLINLFSTQSGIAAVHAAHPRVTVLTSEVHDLVPYHFCKKYFGTD